MPAKYLLNRFFPLQISIRTLLGDARSVFINSKVSLPVGVSS